MLIENFKMAVSSIKSARFRSFLTMFGIIVGVVGVVTTVSLGEGIKKQVLGHTSTVGNDLITVRPGKLVKRDSAGNVSGINLVSFLSASQISDKDYKSISENSRVETAVPLSIINGVPTYGKDTYSDGFVMATSNKLGDAIGQKLEFGDFFGESDDARASAVIGQGVAEKLFKENVPLGKTFKIRGQDFVVSGVFEKFASNPLQPEVDYNNGVYISRSAAKTVTGNENLNIYQILARPKDKSSQGVDDTIYSLSTAIKNNHAGQDDVTVLRQDELLSVANIVLKSITKAVAIMAGIALLVAGIGIMNVMLVSVTERTREIGIRKAVGATNRQIQGQFLVESIVICVWGALIGVITSIVINIALRIFTNLEPIINWPSVGISVLASVAIGIVFGSIPAFKASRNDPITSLRSS